MPVMTGEPSWFEMGVPDGAKAQAFWGALLPVRFQSMGGDSAVIETAGLRGGLHDKDPDAEIRLYFAVDDIDAAVARVRELGGTSDDAGPEQEGFGRFASCVDDQGLRFGLHQRPTSR
jgi:predicted enzyme related to lactoylglutathione lyase